MSILSEKYPSPCLVIASVMANLAGVAFAIAALVLYHLNFLRVGFWVCERYNEYWHGRFITRSPTLSVEEDIMLEKCLEGQEIVRFTGAGRMSVTMAKTDGVTVFTLTSDPQSACPPLCQILKGLCYSPMCCSVSQHLRKVQGTSQSVLGALHIMVGLLNIGLGVILHSVNGPWAWQIQYRGVPYWTGAVFISFGIVSIVSEKRPSPCLVIVNVILNLAGVAFAITAIVVYSIMIADLWLGPMCDDYSYRHRYQYNQPTPSPHEELMKEKCYEGRDMALMLLRGVNGVLIVLAVLEFCVSTSSLVMGIKALCSSEKREDKNPVDPELCKPLMEEVTTY